MLSTISLAAITIAAAADLAPLADDLLHSAPSTHINWSFGSSGQLRQQIEHGAPFDVYLSANERFVRELEDGGFILKGSVRVYAQGRLAMWGSKSRVSSLQDLLKPEVRSIAVPNPTHAPYGAAVVEMLRRVGLLERLKSKIVYGENVRQAYEFARTGNADVVITSWTLLMKLPGARQLPLNLHPSIRQAGGIVARTGERSRAQAFLDYLLSPMGQAILVKGGLDRP